MGGDYVLVHPGVRHHRGRAPRDAALERLCPDVGAGLGDRAAEAGATKNDRAATEARAGTAGATAGGHADIAADSSRPGAADGAATRRARDPARPRPSPRSVRPVQA